MDQKGHASLLASLSTLLHSQVTQLLRRYSLHGLVAPFDQVTLSCRPKPRLYYAPFGSVWSYL